MRTPGAPDPGRRPTAARAVGLGVLLATAGAGLGPAAAGPSDLTPPVQGRLGHFPVRHGPGHQTVVGLAYRPAADEFLAVWAEGPGFPAATNQIQGRLIRRTPPFEPVPASLGEVFLIRDAGVAFVDDPSVAHDPAGDTYLVVWEEGGAGTVTIQAARIDAAGTVLPPGVFRIDTGPCADQDPVVIHNPVDGEWLVAWTEDDSVGCASTGRGVNARRVLADGSRPAPPFDVSANGTAFVGETGLAHAGDPSDPSGSQYLAVYDLEDFAPVPAVTVVRARRISGAGTPQGTELDLATGPVGGLQDATVAYDPRSGQYLAVWRSAITVIEGRLVDRAGALGPRFLIGEPGGADEPAVGVSLTGPAFLVVWQANRDPLDADHEDVFAQWVSGTGTPVGPEVSVSRQPGIQATPLDSHRNVACAGDGGCLVVWLDEDAPESDDDDLTGRFLFAPTAAHFAPGAARAGGP